MEITPDEYELSMAVADSIDELAALRGVTIYPIYQAVKRQFKREAAGMPVKKTCGRKLKYIVVWIDEEE